MQENKVLIYGSLPVVTNEMAAHHYEVDPVSIRKNFTRNKDRFIEGKHYFKLEGEELKEFLQVSLRYSQNEISKIRSLTLWTKQGMARHAKILSTDRAWEVFETLEETYFNPPKKGFDPSSLSRMDILKLAMDAEQENQLLQLENKRMAPKEQFHDAVFKADNTHSIHEVAKIIERGPNKFFQTLRQDHILMANNLPYQVFINQGYFLVSEKPYRKNGQELMASQTRVTGKGLIWLQKKYSSQQLLPIT